MWIDDFPAIRITGEAGRDRSLLVGRAVSTDFLKIGKVSSGYAAPIKD
jgi:hypothetical protein